MKSRLLGAFCACFVSFGLVTSANATFFGRLPATPGGTDFQAYYDDQLDITWTADANINGGDTWNNQVGWADGLTIDGIGGWRLPNMDVNGDGTVVDCIAVTQAACMDNENGHLFRYGAGTTFDGGITVSNPGDFSNIQRDYWSNTEFRRPEFALIFDFGSGAQAPSPKSFINFAWAVRPGEVPIPAAAWLFGSGLIVLLGIARRKR